MNYYLIDLSCYTNDEIYNLISSPKNKDVL